MKSLEVTLREVRSQGRTALVPYFMAGLTDNWVETINALIEGGATQLKLVCHFLIRSWMAL